MKTAILVLATSLVSGAANAAITIFTSASGFEAVTTTRGLDTFNDLAATAYPGHDRSAGDHTYHVGVGPASPLLYGGGNGNDAFLTSANRTDTITLSGFSTGVAGIGGYFFGSDVYGQSMLGGTIFLTVTDADGSVEYDLTGATKNSFVGFVSDKEILSLSFFVNIAGQWVSLDNLTLAAVPEPGSALLAGVGILGLMARRRR